VAKIHEAPALIQGLAAQAVVGEKGFFDRISSSFGALLRIPRKSIV
jgi:hypothetical protein